MARDDAGPLLPRGDGSARLSDPAGGIGVGERLRVVETVSVELNLASAIDSAHSSVQR
jgi:hypothetical protein